MQSISFSIPYDLDVNNPKFSGLVSLIEMYRREGESLFAYIKDEAANIRKQVTAEAQALVDSIVWDWTVKAQGVYPTNMAYQIIATPTLNGEPVTDKAILGVLHLRDGNTSRNGFVFRIVNNVLVTRGGGHVFHYVENGTILEDVEVAYFNQGIVPERFRAFGDAPKS